MERPGKKRCRKKLNLCDSESSSESEEAKQLKYRKVLQRVAIKNSPVEKVKILKNVQICPPTREETESESDLEIFTPPSKKNRKKSNMTNPENQLFLSPSTGKQYTILHNPGPSSNQIVLTPTQKFLRDNNYSKSRASSPDPLQVGGETSRCSSLSNISVTNLLPVQLTEENMRDLLKDTSYTYEKQAIKNDRYVFEHSFDDTDDINTNQINKSIQNLRKNEGTESIAENRENKQQVEEKEDHERKVVRQKQDKEQLRQDYSEQQDIEKDISVNIIQGRSNDDESDVEIENLSTIETDSRAQERDNEQEELRQEQENVQLRQGYSNQQDVENDIGVNIIQSRSNDNESTSDVDESSVENSESSDVAIDEDEESETENDSEGENEVADPVVVDDEDDWIDISDDIDIDFNESTLNSVIIPRLRNKTPAEIYNLFLTDEIVGKIVNDTNKYAEKYLEDHQDEIKEKSRLKAWKPTDDEEMRRFFGVIFVMGLNKVPHINDYWSKKSIYRNEFICSVMPRDRFLIILKFWHFCDESMDNTGDKLYKIRQIQDMLNNRYQEVLRPGKILVIDESMIPWRGRLKFRQYIKNKSHKYGVKLYKLCTPEGYSYNTIVYTGKEGNNREQNHGQKTVLRLIRGLENEGRIVVADNFYSSVGLAEELLTKKTFYCGTLLSNRRGLPKTVVSTKLKKGQCAGKMKPNGVKIIKWCDKRQVLMITTCKNHNTVLVNTGKKTRVTNEDIRKPSCVLLYNENKKGIDYSDQMSSYYTTLKRGLKWYRKMMTEFLFGTALVNAWIIYNMSTTGNKKPKKDFTESIIETFTGKSIYERGTYSLYRSPIILNIQLLYLLF